MLTSMHRSATTLDVAHQMRGVVDAAGLGVGRHRIATVDGVAIAVDALPSPDVRSTHEVVVLTLGLTRIILLQRGDSTRVHVESPRTPVTAGARLLRALATPALHLEHAQLSPINLYRILSALILGPSPAARAGNPIWLTLPRLRRAPRPDASAAPHFLGWQNLLTEQAAIECGIPVARARGSLPGSFEQVGSLLLWTITPRPFDVCSASDIEMLREAYLALPLLLAGAP